MPKDLALTLVLRDEGNNILQSQNGQKQKDYVKYCYSLQNTVIDDVWHSDTWRWAQNEAQNLSMITKWWNDGQPLV